MIYFNKPYLTGKEFHYIYDAVYKEQHISGNGKYTKLCQQFFENRYGFKKCLLTTSCTDALEMAAILCDIQPGDEVIVPSYTFVSTANAFVLRGAKIVFIDSRFDHPGMDVSLIESLITPKTRVIVPVHYAGVACDMDKIMELAGKYDLFVVEDAAQSIDSYYKGRPLGGIGHFGCFSFHETKNVQCGEGGMLVINDEQFFKRSEIIWEKGTNRAEFFRGEVNKYGWVDVGSSFLPSEIVAAFLYAQLENIDNIQKKRRAIWQEFYINLEILEEKGLIKLPKLPEYATNNGHVFYFICNDIEIRDQLINFMKNENIYVIFHYLPLHKSEYYKEKHDGRILGNSVIFSDRIVRLPFFYELQNSDIKFICERLNNFMIAQQ